MEQSMTKANYVMLKALLSGEYLQASLSLEKRAEFQKKTGYTHIDIVIRKLEEMGVINGYIPVLTEKGRKLMDALSTIYEADPEMSSMLEKMG